jgi:hypothetical protein
MVMVSCFFVSRSVMEGGSFFYVRLAIPICYPCSCFSLLGRLFDIDSSGNSGWWRFFYSSRCHAINLDNRKTVLTSLLRFLFLLKSRFLPSIFRLLQLPPSPSISDLCLSLLRSITNGVDFLLFCSYGLVWRLASLQYTVLSDSHKAGFSHYPMCNGQYCYTFS